MTELPIVAAQREARSQSALVSLFRDRRLLTGPLPVILLCLFLVNILVAYHQGPLRRTRRENLLMAAQRHASAGESPRFDWSVGEEVGRFWKSIPDARAHPLVVLSGMSQMYAINEPAAGDETIAELLDDKMRQDGIRVFGLAAPNLDNEEALLYYVAAGSDPATKPTVFLYGLCFDKFRNLDVRAGIGELLGRARVRRAWAQACDGAMAADLGAACAQMRRTLALMPNPVTGDPSHLRVQGILEVRTRALAERLFPVVDLRHELNVIAQLEAFKLRNALLHITPTSKRPIIRSRYAVNQELLELLARLTKRDSVVLILYVIPLNPQAENPYVAGEYREFKAWARELATRYQLPFADFENVVPSDRWGMFQGGPDFKHFKGAGHRMTAEAILNTFGPAIRSAARHGGHAQ